MMTFLEFLEQDEKIANDEIYLANMSKSFADKTWFLKFISKDITTVVDFGGGAGEFAEYCKSTAKGKNLKFIIIDNNESFLSQAREKGFICFTSLDELLENKGKAFDPAHTCLVLSSVIHEVYSYSDPFYDDVGVFWSSLKKCNFRAIAIRDMSISSSAFKTAPIDSILWMYENVFTSPAFQYKGHLLKDIVESFEDEWGAICDLEAKKVDIKRLIHFLIKYRYQENWKREVKENYLPISQDKLKYWLVDFMGYALDHKESSNLEFYHKRWAKDFKLLIPDNGNHRKRFLAWLMQIDTHIKWLATKNVSESLNENKKTYLQKFKDEDCVEDIVSKFWVIRQKLKFPQNDIDYWIKKPFSALKSFVDSFDNRNQSQKKSDEAKEIAEDNGAQMLDVRDGYEIWYVPTYEAAIQLGRFYKGRSCKWCISSEDPSFWFENHSESEFIFLIRKDFKHDENDKVAIEFEDGGRYFNIDNIRTWNIENADEETFFNDSLLYYAWELFKDNGVKRSKWSDSDYA